MCSDTTDPNPFYTLASTYDEIIRANHRENFGRTLAGILGAPSQQDARLKVISLLDDCSDILSFTSLAQQRMKSNLKFVAQCKDTFICNCSKGTNGEFITGAKAKDVSERLAHMGDVVAPLISPNTAPLDRDDLIRRTKSLLSALEVSALKDYERKAMALNLKSLIRVVDECRDLSDAQVKRRVKAIYAEYCSDTERLDNTALYKAMTEWARETVGAGIVGIGLIGSVTGIAGYIENHTSGTIIEAQESTPESDQAVSPKN